MDGSGHNAPVCCASLKMQVIILTNSCSLYIESCPLLKYGREKNWRERKMLSGQDKSISKGDQSSGQRESFFQSRDENESFSDSISFIETRPRIPDTYSQASRRDREKDSSNLGHRDEIEIYFLHSQTSRREREFP